MVMRGEDDDTSGGAVTQGGHRDADAPGPARRSGNSFLWFGAALIVLVVIAVAWIGLPSHKQAPAERNTTPLSHQASGQVLRLPAQALSP